MDQPGTIDNPANRENENIPVSVRGREFDLARRVRPSRPASACSFSILRLNLVLIHGIPLAFHDSVHIYIYIYIYTINRHRFNPECIRSLHCVPMAFTVESPPAQGQ